NCDSVQVYQRIQIATAKVPLAERRGVPHHLIDFVSPHVNFTAADWTRVALKKIEEIESRNRRVLLVGGTGFYLRALRQPFFPSPPTNEELRARLTRIRARRGPEHLHRILQRFDREAAEKLNARDWPRVQRAIEQTKVDVRHYAKRQLTWFRQEPGVEWLDGFGDDAAVQERALAVLSA